MFCVTQAELELDQPRAQSAGISGVCMTVKQSERLLCRPIEESLGRL
jgi:hypothetical protein